MQKYHWPFYFTDNKEILKKVLSSLFCLIELDTCLQLTHTHINVLMIFIHSILIFQETCAFTWIEIFYFSWFNKETYWENILRVCFFFLLIFLVLFNLTHKIFGRFFLFATLRSLISYSLLLFRFLTKDTCLFLYSS